LKRVLVTGMSGTGKSADVEELARRGYRAVDVDSPEWSFYDADGEWIWKEDRVRDLLEESKGDLLFVSGCAENQVQFHPQFAAIILLSAPVDVVVDRLNTRTTNDFGKDPDELANVIHYIDTFEPRLRRVASHEIVTISPLHEVVDAVIEIAAD
jgi:broad-specificity NMP kinase